MMRLCCASAIAVLASLVLASVARADVVITSTTRGAGLGMVTEGETVTYLSGLKMRSDITIRGERISTIIDLESARFILLDHRGRNADVFDLRDAGRELQKAAVGDVTVTLTPSGGRKAISGLLCVEHALEASVAVADGAGEPMHVRMRGPVWIATDSPAAADWRRFYTAASDRGLFFTDPRAARADPARTRGLTALYKRMAELGVPYETEIEISHEGTGPAAAVLGRMGRASMSSSVTRVVVEPVSISRFVVPDGYDVREK